MDGAISLDGLVGVVIFLATVILLAIIVLITLAVYLLGRNSKQSESRWSKHLLISASILLVVDGIFYAFLNKTFKGDEGALFSQRMVLIWIPFHVVSYFLLAAMFRFIDSRKGKINKFIDKLR